MKIRRGIFRIFVVFLVIWGAAFFGIAGVVASLVPPEFSVFVFAGAFFLWIGAVIVILGTGKTAGWVVDGFKDEEKMERKRIERAEKRIAESTKAKVIEVEKPREMRIWAGAPHADGGYWHHVPERSQRRW